MRRRKKNKFIADNYSVIIIPKDKSRVRRFQVSRTRVFSYILISCAIAAFASITTIGLLHYRQQVMATEGLRERGYRYEEERQQVLAKLHELEALMNRSEDLALKLERVAGVTAQSSVAGLNAEHPKKGMHLVSLNLPKWKKDAHVFDDKALKSTHLKTIDLLDRAQDIEDRLEKVSNFTKDAGYFWSSMPTVWPTKGWVTSGFGIRRSPLSGKRQHHTGLDIAAPLGSDVRAPGDGIVTFSGRYGGFGKMVIVDHGYGIATLYGHNSKLLVKAGDEVKRGQLISQIGNTGRSTGPHLHYEVIIDGVPIDPMKYIIE